MAERLVSDLMTTPVLTVAPTDAAGDVIGAMAEEGIKSVVVITDDCAVDGIFTATDYMRLAAGGDPAETSVGECMTTGVVTVAPTDTVETAATRMVDNDISHLPVVDADGQVTGMVTSTDLATVLAE
jgi:CBS domain-containing protein